MTNKPVSMRFTVDTMSTLERIDTISKAFKISRPSAIKLVFDRLVQIDPTLNNPISSLPTILL